MPLFLEYDDQEDGSTREKDKEEKREVVDIEEHKISGGSHMGAKPAAGVTSSARLQDMRKPKEREDKSLDDLFEIETYSDDSSLQQDAGQESLKSTNLLLDQVEDHLQRCCRNLLHIIPGVLLRNGHWESLKAMNLKVFRMLLKVQKRRNGDRLLILSCPLSRKARPGSLVFYVKTVMLFRSSRSSKESWCVKDLRIEQELTSLRPLCQFLLLRSTSLHGSAGFHSGVPQS